MSAPRSLLDEVLPHFDANELHDIWIPARPQVVFAAVKQVTVREVRLLIPLETLRGLPGLLARHPAFRPTRSEPLLDQFTLGVVVLGERPDAEIAAGASAASGASPVTSRRRCARARTSSPLPSPDTRKQRSRSSSKPERGGSRVITETRVAGTSPEATRALLRYWRAIRLGSGAIRRSWLAAIRRRAVRAG